MTCAEAGWIADELREVTAEDFERMLERLPYTREDYIDGVVFLYAFTPYRCRFGMNQLARWFLHPALVPDDAAPVIDSESAPTRARDK